MLIERRFFAAPVAVLLLCVGAALPAGASSAKLGKVTFPVSCNAAAQKEFEIAMAYYHSFAWPQVKATLDGVIKADPGCGMAHWARALGYLDNPFLWPGSLTPKVLADAQAALDAARAAGLKTQRERDYVDALAAFFRDTDKLNQMGDAVCARADHNRLLGLDRQLAAKLEAAIARRIAGEDQAGIAPQYE